MSTFTGRLDKLEAQLQAFIEGKLARLSPLRGQQENLGRRLVMAMRAGTISTGDGTLLAPDRFIVLANPKQADLMQGDLPMLKEFAALIREVGAEAGLHFVQPPEVVISANEDIPEHQVEILARISESALGSTTDMTGPQGPEGAAFPEHAFVILNGTQIYALEQAVVNIGRRSDNHLVIEDPRVSRHHAQIRAVNGRYEIFDLESTGGTFVNRQRITQSVLHPGDVISLAGVPLIYGQEASGSLGETQEYLPPIPE